METMSQSSASRAQILQAMTSPKTLSEIKKPKTLNTTPISKYFGELTFGLAQMREKLPKESYTNLIRCLEKGEKLSDKSADAIASALKEWAVNMGVTHFCHWFQPLTGSTAEKHDSFIHIQTSYHSELKVIERFTGSQLIQGEPDASSFPSGGMRSTFEARGYTAWDPTAPLFILEGEYSRTLCIPTVFFGYHGQALDHKTPLLRSNLALNERACEFLKLIGDIDVKNVTSTIGAEQEYFLIDRRFAAMRPDIIMTGRTLLGATPPRGQQLEDHYFGSIPDRVQHFMEDLERELYRLGIPVKTRHNEVAPSQFELAPIFENASIAADHNTLTMECLKNVANKHGLYCLLHEKPFKGLNGSGKHCNWSMSNDKGENLLEPGKTPHQNLRFLAVLAVIMRAVNDHSDLLRAAIASPGNDHRLGANEAPPAIISVFLGSFLSEILLNIESGKRAGETTETKMINLGVSSIPDISKDYTDRNRTSPFAFTGNKFEFRAVGSSANISLPVSYVNASVADSFMKSTAHLSKLIAKIGKRDEAVMEFVKEVITETKRVHFEGDNYSQEWRDEAERRKLPILPDTAAALKVYKNPASYQALIEQKVYSEPEIMSRLNIQVERYIKTLVIEMDTLNELATTCVVPAIEKQLSQTYNVLNEAKHSGLKTLYKTKVEALESALEKLLFAQSELDQGLNALNDVHDEMEKMDRLARQLRPIQERVREAADLAETMVSDELWPLPKYREMLFTHQIS
jgi:glutamine synthetase